MVSMKRVLLGVLISCGLLMAQRSDTVYQTLLTASNPTSLPYTIPVTVRNIGQGFHSISFELTDLTTGSCTGGNVIIVFQGSYDNTTWNTIITLVRSTGGTNPPNYAYEGIGVFPFYRTIIATYPSATCN